MTSRTADTAFYFLALVLGLVLAFCLNGCACGRSELAGKSTPVCAKSTKLTVGKKGEDHDVYVESYVCEVWMTADGLRPAMQPEPPSPPGTKKETRVEPQETPDIPSPEIPKGGFEL